MNKNTCIHCDVVSCKYNCETESYCSLNEIKVGTHEPHPTMPECADCQSFVKRNG